MARVKEIEEYRQYTGPAEHQKAVNSFLGILEGIAIDGIIDQKETLELQNWYELYRGLIDRHPFNEILPAVDSALADQIITCEEVEDLLWLCKQVMSGDYYDLVTSATQTLHGLIHGILANDRITDGEVYALKDWLLDHSLLKGTYTFDEIYSLICAITEDGVITEEERSTLKAFFSEFVDPRDSFNLNALELENLREHYSVQGICAKDPEIIIPNHVFCFTGTSSIATRNEIAEIISSYNGTFVNTVTKKTQYLIVGAEGNPCWAFSCYGRKIEKAVSMRKSGCAITIINENDFWLALEALK